MRKGFAPGHLFSADRRFHHHLRIDCGHPDDARTLVAIRTLGDIVKSLMAT